MKIPYLASAALLAQAIIAPIVSAQTYLEEPDGSPGDVPGNVSTLSFNLTISETVGGHRVTEAQRQRDLNRGVRYYEDALRYDAVFNPGQPSEPVLNPFAWATVGTHHFVERVTERLDSTGAATTVTANGVHKIHKTRYTNTTLLNDLALLHPGRVTSARGWRLVAVRFDGVPFAFNLLYNTPTHVSIVRPGLYFFAEQGANDPQPIFIGAEDNLYAVPQLIDFASFETVEGGKYVDRFDRTPTDTWDYTLVSDAYSGQALGEFAVYRRPGTVGEYLQMRAGGVLSWRETYDSRRNTYNRGAITGRNLTGPGALYSAGENTGQHESIVTGTVSMGSASYRPSMKKYLDALPPVP